ncbi:MULTISPECIES: VOC family protein [Lysinibacillus]|uniref:VOC domain-containing protein n=1 Tax=Lysinibacillus tabacifolii TaxID=1173107 RepID=A0ABY2T241_9BACI|nr:VOC family protein [Lysinibacillus tabacifolii]TKI50073.1 hypothetical protein FC748_02275 [Lysinibacillus tabacifolii]
MKISKIKLYAYDLHKMREFYCTLLGFELLDEGTHFFDIAAGESKVRFEKIEASVAKQYHFAFNIPSNLFQLAKKWAKERVDVLSLDGVDEVYFKTIDAYSCYFYDAENNVVELIARQQINPSVNADTFSIQHILNIAEINLTTDAIADLVDRLKEYDITPLKGEDIRPDALTFMGNYEESAHLLIGPSERLWYFSTRKAIISPIQIEVNKEIVISMTAKGNFAISEQTKDR